MKNNMLYMVVGFLLIAIGLLLGYIFFFHEKKIDPVPYKPKVETKESKKKKAVDSYLKAGEKTAEDKQDEVEEVKETELPAETVVLEDLSPDEAQARSFLYEGEYLNDNDLRLAVNAKFDEAIGGLRGKSVRSIEELGAETISLGATDSAMVTTIYLFFVYQGYKIDESYTRVYSSKISPDIRQVVFKGIHPEREDVYFVAHFNEFSGQFTVLGRYGGTIEGAFG